jgi:hypothetical protein
MLSMTALLMSHTLVVTLLTLHTLGIGIIMGLQILT